MVKCMESISLWRVYGALLFCCKGGGEVCREN